MASGHSAEKDAACEVGFCRNPGDPYTVTPDESGRARTTAMGHVGWTAGVDRPVPQHVIYCPMHALDLLGFSVTPPAARGFGLLREGSPESDLSPITGGPDLETECVTPPEVGDRG